MRKIISNRHKEEGKLAYTYGKLIITCCYTMRIPQGHEAIRAFNVG